MLTVVGGNVWERREEPEMCPVRCVAVAGLHGDCHVSVGLGVQAKIMQLLALRNFGKCFDCYDHV